jgi:anti-sigma B factor antagonist
MTLTLVDVSAATVLRLRGEFDLSNTPDVEDALAVAASTDHRLLVIDLSEMTFAGTPMMRALLAGQAAAMSQGRRMVLVRPTPIVWHSFEVMGLDRLLTAYETVEAALDAEHSD